MGSLTVRSTPLAGVKVIERVLRGDDRGSFARLFCQDELAEVWPDAGVVQINQSMTKQRGTVRGLHFQRPPHDEAKLVSCLHGEIFDVAVDVREGSPTYLQWYGEVLSGENGRALLIPHGFAHGHQALTDDCMIVYVMDTPYAPSSEGGINVRDPKVGVEWPAPITLLSAKDLALPML